MLRFTLISSLLFSTSVYANTQNSTTLSDDLLVQSEAINTCESDISKPFVKFLDTGSICIEGIRAHIDGRGCKTIFWEKGENNQYTFFCKTRDTCDITHVGKFVAYPVTVDISSVSFQNPPVCADLNYIIFHEQSAVSE